MRVVHEPTEADALQYDGTNLREIGEFVRPYNCEVSIFMGSYRDDCKWTIYRHYDQNSFPFKEGDWIMRRDSGCVYVCTNEAFERNWRRACVFPSR